MNAYAIAIVVAAGSADQAWETASTALGQLDECLFIGDPRTIRQAEAYDTRAVAVALAAPEAHTVNVLDRDLSSEPLFDAAARSSDTCDELRRELAALAAHLDARAAELTNRGEHGLADEAAHALCAVQDMESLVRTVDREMDRVREAITDA